MYTGILATANLQALPPATTCQYNHKKNIRKQQEKTHFCETDL